MSYPYGIYNAIFSDGSPSRSIVVFGSSKIIMKINTENVPMKLGFFDKGNDKSPIIELIFNRSDDISALERQLKVIKKQLKKIKL